MVCKLKNDVNNVKMYILQNNCLLKRDKLLLKKLHTMLRYCEAEMEEMVVMESQDLEVSLEEMEIMERKE